VRKVLRRLAEQGVVIEQRNGRFVYVGKREHILWPAVEVLMSAADRLDTTIREHVEVCEVPALAVELFGSVAACDRCLGVLSTSSSWTRTNWCENETARSSREIFETGARFEVRRSKSWLPDGLDKGHPRPH